MKSYRHQTIQECGEPLVAIPEQVFAFANPHPYVALGAPYEGASPWMVRSGVAAALLRAQANLDARKPGWKIKLYDAYRPNAVQAFMVWREFNEQATRAGTSLAAYGNLAALAMGNPELYEMLASKVFKFWGIPSDDPETPPPHSTGAALDCSLQTDTLDEVDMGCPVDEMYDRAHPDYYKTSRNEADQLFHQRRELLHAVLGQVGFKRHECEWWHFSLGDQMWSWHGGGPCAIYGRAESERLSGNTGSDHRYPLQS